MKLLIINGANLNLLGKREPDIYGSTDFDSFFTNLLDQFPTVDLNFFQSNIEGELVDMLQEADLDHYDGIILNAGGYTHTSVAIADAVAAIETPVIEVHISNIFSREEFRKTSLTAPHCKGLICGFGLTGYTLAIQSFLK